MFALWFPYVARTPSFQIVSCYGFSKYIAFATYLDLSRYITCVHRKAWTNLQFGTEGVYCIQLIFPRKKKLFPSFCCLCQWFAILICCVLNGWSSMAFVELAPCCLLSICVSLTSARYIDGWAMLFWLEIDPSEILPWVLVITLCTWIAAEVYGMWMHIIKSPKSKEEHAFDGCPVVLNFLSRFYMFFFPGPGTWLADCWVDC